MVHALRQGGHELCHRDAGRGQMRLPDRLFLRRGLAAKRVDEGLLYQRRPGQPEEAVRCHSVKVAAHRQKLRRDVVGVVRALQHQARQIGHLLHGRRAVVNHVNQAAHQVADIGLVKAAFEDRRVHDDVEVVCREVAVAHDHMLDPLGHPRRELRPGDRVCRKVAQVVAQLDQRRHAAKRVQVNLGDELGVRQRAVARGELGRRQQIGRQRHFVQLAVGDPGDQHLDLGHVHVAVKDRVKDARGLGQNALFGRRIQAHRTGAGLCHIASAQPARSHRPCLNPQRVDLVRDDDVGRGGRGGHAIGPAIAVGVHRRPRDDLFHSAAGDPRDQPVGRGRGDEGLDLRAALTIGCVHHLPRAVGQNATFRQFVGDPVPVVVRRRRGRPPVRACQRLEPRAQVTVSIARLADHSPASVQPDRRGVRRRRIYHPVAIGIDPGGRRKPVGRGRRRFGVDHLFRAIGAVDRLVRFVDFAEGLGGGPVGVEGHVGEAGKVALAVVVDIEGEGPVHPVGRDLLGDQDAAGAVQTQVLVVDLSVRRQVGDINDAAVGLAVTVQVARGGQGAAIRALRAGRSLGNARAGIVQRVRLDPAAVCRLDQRHVAVGVAVAGKVGDDRGPQPVAAGGRGDLGNRILRGVPGRLLHDDIAVGGIASGRVGPEFEDLVAVQVQHDGRPVAVIADGGLFLPDHLVTLVGVGDAARHLAVGRKRCPVGRRQVRPPVAVRVMRRGGDQPVGRGGAGEPPLDRSAGRKVGRGAGGHA